MSLGTGRRVVNVSANLYGKLSDYCRQTGDSMSSVVEAVIVTVLDAADGQNY